MSSTDSLLELIERLRPLPELTPESVAGVTEADLTERTVANPHFRAYITRLFDPAADLELWVPKPTARFRQGRLMVRPHELTVSREQVRARWGDGQIGDVNPDKGEEGSVSYVFSDPRQKVIVQCTARSNLVIQVVLDRQRA